MPHHQPQGLLQGGYGISGLAVRTQDPFQDRSITKALLPNLVMKEAVSRRLPYDWAQPTILWLLLICTTMASCRGVGCREPSLALRIHLVYTLCL